MKPSLVPARRAAGAWRTLRAALGAVAAASLLAACGQKGPLYMPVRPPAPVQPPAPAKPPPAPTSSAAPAAASRTPANP